MQRGLVGSEMCIRDSINAEYMGTFRGTEKVKQAVLTYMATQLSDKELQPLKWMFIDMDKNGDGILSLEEIELGLKGKTNESELKAIMYSLDTCLLYTSDAADDTPCVDLGGRRIIKKKKQST
eukprot:TRINITY_DN10676_c0_g1_i4.p3 TRINITY_DN10676_c0_g1~~TRINITY_DN10676_c0_g1_i4.p3  ORF type:complete len:123 (-),score=40.72 TRINITY_DN10676_c0_g1_i4:101-469(-)